MHKQRTYFDTHRLTLPFSSCRRPFHRRSLSDAVADSCLLEELSAAAGPCSSFLLGRRRHAQQGQRDRALRSAPEKSEVTPRATATRPLKTRAALQKEGFPESDRGALNRTVPSTLHTVFLILLRGSACFVRNSMLWTNQSHWVVQCVLYKWLACKLKKIPCVWRPGQEVFHINNSTAACGGMNPFPGDLPGWFCMAAFLPVAKCKRPPSISSPSLRRRRVSTHHPRRLIRRLRQLLSREQEFCLFGRGKMRWGANFENLKRGLAGPCSAGDWRGGSVYTFH